MSAISDSGDAGRVGSTGLGLVEFRTHVIRKYSADTRNGGDDIGTKPPAQDTETVTTYATNNNFDISFGISLQIETRAKVAVYTAGKKGSASAGTAKLTSTGLVMTSPAPGP